MLQYDPTQVTLMYAGFLIDGFAEDSFITVETNEDRFSTYVGCSAEVTRNINPNQTGKITVRLAQSSPSNAILDAEHGLDSVTGRNVRSVVVLDGNGFSIHSAPEAWIVRPANADYNKEATEREWIIECAKLDSRSRGNSPI